MLEELQTSILAPLVQMSQELCLLKLITAKKSKEFLLNLASDNAVTGVAATVGSISSADATRTAGTYKDVGGSSGGSGTGQRFTIVIDGTGAASVTITNGGSGHSASDTITVTVTDL